MDELMDRYGDIPQSVHTLLDVALLRAAASKAGISDISQRGDAVKFTVARFDVGAIGRVCSSPKYRQRLQLAAGDTPSLTLRLRPKEQVLAAALELVEDLELAGGRGEEN